MHSVNRNSKNKYGTDRGLRAKARLGATLGIAALGIAALAGSAAAQAVPAATTPHWQTAYRTESATGGFLVGVTAPAKNDAWAVGATNKEQPIVVNWNGKTWRSVNVPGTAAAGFDPFSVESTAPGNVWIAGADRSGLPVAHVWNAKSWRTLALPAFLSGVAVISPSDVWGYNGEGLGCADNAPSTTCLYHWNGSKWASVQVPIFGQALTAAGGHAWFFGLTGTNTPKPGQSPTGRPAIYELTGGTVRKVSAPSTRVQQFSSAAAAPDGQLWWEAPLATAKAPMTLFHWTGSRWTASAIPASVGGLPTIVDGTMAYDGKSGVWASPELHWTGSKWVNAFALGLFGGDGFGLSAVAAIGGSSSIWAVGAVTRTPSSQTFDPLVAVWGPLP
jgi:hypothetical protein